MHVSPEGTALMRHRTAPVVWAESAESSGNAIRFGPPLGGYLDGSPYPRQRHARCAHDDSPDFAGTKRSDVRDVKIGSRV